MAGYRIRDKIDAQLYGMAGAFFAILGVGAIAEYAGYGSDYWIVALVGAPVPVGFLCRWGWELRRWYCKTRPGYDPLAGLRPKP